MALLLGLLALTCQDAKAQFADAAPTDAIASGDAAGEQSATLLTAEELNTLVAPIALYPDELLAIVLPASTNPIQIVEAQRFLDQRAKDPNLQPDQEWDPSVLALINYPEALKKLSDDIGWCQDLGNALLDQQEDLLNAIQAARGSASDAGYLQSNDQVTVVNEGDNITVESKDPEVIYVPQYDPAPVVYNNYTNYPPPYYSDPYPPYWAPAATFFTGMFVGAAFSYGFDWNNDDIDIDNDINIDNSRGDVSIGGDRTNIDKTKLQNKFNGERKAGSTDKMKWSGQKARQKSSATRRTPDAKRPNSANIQKQLGQGGSGQLQGNQKLKNNAAARNQSSRGNQSLKQNNKSTQQLRQNNTNKQQMRNQQQRQKQPQQRQARPNSNKGGGAFAGQGNQRVKQQSARGNKSMNRPKGGGGKPSRPPRASGGRR
ncbi:MAG TPA: DUF3300 domain-containing protein [Dongiaceae bacterium]|nr:DUF3300 domain-containing protein [Dongiaceae bacterium]